MTSATVMPLSIAACRSMWSEPMPAVMASFSFLALAIRSFGQVGRPERLRDHDLGVGQLALEHGVRAVLVGGHDQRVALALEELAQAQLAGDAAEQLRRA